MTPCDFQGNSPTASLSKCDFSYSCAAVDKTSTDTVNCVMTVACVELGILQTNQDMESTCRQVKKGKGSPSPYSITKHRVQELIPVLGSQPADDVVINLAVGCHYFPPGLQLHLQPLRRLLPILLLGEQRHNGCEQFA